MNSWPLKSQVTSHTHAQWIHTSRSLPLTWAITVGFYQSRCLRCIAIKLWIPKTKVCDHLICLIFCGSKPSIPLLWFSCMKEGPSRSCYFLRKVPKGLQALSSLRSEKSYGWRLGSKSINRGITCEMQAVQNKTFSFYIWLYSTKFKSNRSLSTVILIACTYFTYD